MKKSAFCDKKDSAFICTVLPVLHYFPYGSTKNCSVRVTTTTIVEKKTSSNFIKSLIALESRHVFTISSLYLLC